MNKAQKLRPLLAIDKQKTLYIRLRNFQVCAGLNLYRASLKDCSRNGTIIIEYFSVSTNIAAALSYQDIF